MDNLITNNSQKLMSGIKKIANVVGSTMGTSGNNVLIEALERPGFYATNDGYSIANAIRFEDPNEELGRKILLEAINRANKASGDGSSTTCVLTAAILEEGTKYLGKKSPMEIKRSLDELIPVIEDSIRKQSQEISVDSVAPVATISAEDEEIGNKIQEIYQKIGKDGIIYWEASRTPDDYYTIGTGLKIDGASFVSPYMCDVDEVGRFMNGINWKDAKVLLSKQKIISHEDLNSIMAELYNKGTRELVIFCEEIEMPVVSTLIKARIERGFKTMIVKMPILWRDEWWEDLAIASGGKVINPNAGLSLKDVKVDDLGTFGNIIVTKDDTFIDGIQDLTQHIEALLATGNENDLTRAARLNTKTARYFVGAHSESALAYRRLKVEDAINAASCALTDGVVVGGGVALLNVSRGLPNTIGGDILKASLTAPIKKIVSNAGLQYKERKYGGTIGVDTRNGGLTDMLKYNIIDPTLVVINAVKNAIGVASSILSTNAIILYPKEEKQNV